MMTKDFDMLYNKFANIYAKATDIETILNSYDTLNCFKEFNMETQNKFIEIIKMLQCDLTNNIEELQNNFIKLHFYGII